MPRRMVYALSLASDAWLWPSVLLTSTLVAATARRGSQSANCTPLWFLLTVSPGSHLECKAYVHFGPPVQKLTPATGRPVDGACGYGTG